MNFSYWRWLRGEKTRIYILRRDAQLLRMLKPGTIFHFYMPKNMRFSPFKNYFRANIYVDFLIYFMKFSITKIIDGRFYSMLKRYLFSLIFFLATCRDAISKYNCYLCLLFLLILLCSDRCI